MRSLLVLQMAYIYFDIFLNRFNYLSYTRKNLIYAFRYLQYSSCRNEMFKYFWKPRSSQESHKL